MLAIPWNITFRILLKQLELIKMNWITIIGSWEVSKCNLDTCVCMYVPINGLATLEKKIALVISYDRQSSQIGKNSEKSQRVKCIFFKRDGEVLTIIWYLLSIYYSYRFWKKLSLLTLMTFFFQIRFKIGERKLRLKKLVPQIVSDH